MGSHNAAALNRQQGIICELARSSRSSCRVCQKQISKDAPRCGLEVKVKSRWATRWCHAQCFLDQCMHLTQYEGSRKAKCHSSGEQICKGDQIVRFSVGDAKVNHL